ncbi:hypothetical protein B0T18DRAFT_182809 [Schizothecium vesticola]|uniref:Uncharacterized protein n=1 Tax=Schizothecium vesticola TaxID=314040 RepID=A0AA40EPZ4_9PEZI|nr:hypothetical protein B0T18DRAFT_182809 [Schizothecium vesticola]
MPFSHHQTLHFPLPMHTSLQSSQHNPVSAPHSSHPTASTGTHPVSQLGIHTSKCCTLAGSHTYLPLPTTPYLSKRPIISASSLSGLRCGGCTCAPPPSPPARLHEFVVVRTNL